MSSLLIIAGIEVRKTDEEKRELEPLVDHLKEEVKV